MGQAEGGMYLVENDDDVSRPSGVSDGQAGLCHADHACRSTTPPLIVSPLRSRFPDIIGPKRDDICYATQNRQDAVKFMAPRSDLVLVVGSPNSSNSNRLREVAENRGVPAYLLGAVNVSQLAGSIENIVFSIPRELQQPAD
jgi:4-hydroxy-3-methylbut-2-enyl diphosphate reductase